LARAITLIESSSRADRADATQLLQAVHADPPDVHRLGITGAPGVGKSTLIDALGRHLVGEGHRVAVLAVDPSSVRSGGSIMGDKTRMRRLAAEGAAFIRPSPSGGVPGGVARTTRESISLCAAAGHDVVIVETVGVGQSEVMVSDMVDFFLVLLGVGAGDEVQGIKRGVLELADLVAITKADSGVEVEAERVRQQFAGALALSHSRYRGWKPSVITCSTRSGRGIAEIWEKARAHRRALEASGEWEENRKEQRRRWLWLAVERGLQRALHDDPGVRARLASLEAAVTEGTMTPEQAAALILHSFTHGRRDSRAPGGEPGD
jgi:LAO/AO transport system kinase